MRTLILFTAIAVMIGGCAMTEKTTPRPEREPGRILGIGGVFFRSDDGKALQAWYGKNLGLPTDTQGYAVLPWVDEHSGAYNSTTWGAFSRDTTYFDTEQQYMINYVVDDLDAVLDRLKAAGTRVADERMEEAYGKFGWFWDPEGTKVELWEPNTVFMEKARNKGGSWE